MVKRLKIMVSCSYKAVGCYWTPAFYILVFISFPLGDIQSASFIYVLLLHSKALKISSPQGQQRSMASYK
ncbi:hypothetical protein GGTG_04355 [Gaeumannomyces tritici R3-111a-1]|uniref:Uncharacterized protein n=1 Tax=Gaeumannomyces tritici (strain R3-111a-1) TaxID=644352 RepID=J3NSV6_GAET3|nr:hypothetical protein GGTG_04355 [Gaeumannomyces tritici R3-111a-1]EJT79269.1 hypothetical protein GGTG_04355 [Gaeumannomyces tritici R3-111a-1]